MEHAAEADVDVASTESEASADMTAIAIRMFLISPSDPPPEKWSDLNYVF